MKSRLKNKVTTLIGADVTVAGNLIFEHGCHVGGTVKGDVSGPDNKHSELAVAPTGRIEGNTRAGCMLIQGTILGDLRCGGTVTLTSTARIEGSIQCAQIEMEKGAIMKGQLLMSSSKSSESIAAAAPGSESDSGEQAQPSLT